MFMEIRMRSGCKLWDIRLRKRKQKSIACFAAVNAVAVRHPVTPAVAHITAADTWGSDILYWKNKSSRRRRVNMALINEKCWKAEENMPSASLTSTILNGLKQFWRLRKDIVRHPGRFEGAARYMGGYKTVTGGQGAARLQVTVDVSLHLDRLEFEACKRRLTRVSLPSWLTLKSIRWQKTSNHQGSRGYARRSVSISGLSNHRRTETTSLLRASSTRTWTKRRAFESHRHWLPGSGIGGVHGPYKAEPKLGFKEMEEIKNATNFPSSSRRDRHSVSR